MSEYLNYIQLASGILSAGFVFAGIFISAKKLNPEKYEMIPVKTTVISTALIIAGLLCYTLMKTCTNMTIVTEEQYELGTLYFASLEEVVKSLGFIVSFLSFSGYSSQSHREEIRSKRIFRLRLKRTFNAFWHFENNMLKSSRKSRLF